jgi:hypothetical protein
MTLLTANLNYRCRFLSGRYTDILFMICGYDAEQQLLSLTFIVVACEKSVANSGCVKRLPILVRLPLSQFNIWV